MSADPSSKRYTHFLVVVGVVAAVCA